MPKTPKCSCPAVMRKYTPGTHLSTCPQYPLVSEILLIFACAMFCAVVWIFAVAFAFGVTD